MKTISDILRGEPVWVNPGHRVDSAVMLMRGHDVSGLPVLEGTQLIGMVSIKQLLGIEGTRQVREVMDSKVTAAPSVLSVREAAELMMRECLERLPVVSPEGTLLGMITNSDLLAELRRPADPITELSWSDSMREWAVDKLRNGYEITLLFLDIDDFGNFNKKYGHIVGDAVLKNVANVLRDATDLELDSLCRYGGDEFCIASLRTSAQAARLADKIRQEIDALRIPEAGDQGISITIGQRGGKRTREREKVHYTATLNNLINLASLDCLMQKRNREAGETSPDLPPTSSISDAEPPEGEPPAYASFEPDSRAAEEIRSVQANGVSVSTSTRPNLRLALLEVSWVGTVATVHIALENEADSTEPSVSAPPGAETAGLPRGRFEAVVSRPIDTGGLTRLVADVTVTALRRALPGGYELRLDEVLTARTAENRTLMIVVGVLQTPTDSRPLAGCAFIGSDGYRAAAAAVLAATNRQLTRLFSSSFTLPPELPSDRAS